MGGCAYPSFPHAAFSRRHRRLRILISLVPHEGILCSAVDVVCIWVWQSGNLPSIRMISSTDLNWFPKEEVTAQWHFPQQLRTRRMQQGRFPSAVGSIRIHRLPPSIVGLLPRYMCPDMRGWMSIHMRVSLSDASPRHAGKRFQARS